MLTKAFLISFSMNATSHAVWLHNNLYAALLLLIIYVLDVFGRALSSRLDFSGPTEHWLRVKPHTESNRHLICGILCVSAHLSCVCVSYVWAAVSSLSTLDNKIPTEKMNGMKRGERRRERWMNEWNTAVEWPRTMEWRNICEWPSSSSYTDSSGDRQHCRTHIIIFWIM